MFLVNGFMVGSWAPQIPLVLKRLDISESTLGLLILCFGIGALVSMPWCGWLMGRYGQQPVLRTVGLLQGVGMLLVVASSSVSTTAVSMFVFGALIGCTDVAMNSATITVEQKLRRAVMSSMHGFWSLGGFVGGAIGGLALLTLGPLAHAAAVAVVAVAASAAALPFILRNDLTNETGDATKRGIRLPNSPVAYVLGLMALILFVGEGAVLDWAALFMTQERGADVATAGLAYAFFAGAMAIMRFAGDAVRNRFGAVNTLRVSSLIAAVGMLAAALITDPVLVIVAFAISGLGFANTVPVVFSAAGNLPGVSSNAGMSVVTTMGYSGILLAPSAIGFVAEKSGFVPVFLGLAALVIVVFFLAGLTAPADGARDQPAA
ncbi:MAG: MFS transporter [Rhizobiaceae bacterium]